MATNSIIRLPLPLLLSLLLPLLLGEPASGDLAKDRAECQGTLVGLSTCLTYMQEKAAAPTQDCCDGLGQILATNKKCLCTLINDRDDPDLGFKFNATRALLLPGVCHHPTNISECITLLGLAPHSQAAQIFEQFGTGNTTTGSGGEAAAARGSSGREGAVKNGAGPSRRSVGGWPVRVGGAGAGGFFVSTLLLAGLIIIN